MKVSESLMQPRSSFSPCPWQGQEYTGIVCPSLCLLWGQRSLLPRPCPRPTALGQCGNRSGLGRLKCTVTGLRLQVKSQAKQDQFGVGKQPSGHWPARPPLWVAVAGWARCV